MKVALLIAGYTRSFKLTLPTIKKHILKFFSEVDIYMHFNPNSKDDQYLNDTTSLEYIISELNPKTLLLENVPDEKSDPPTIWAKFYKLNKLKNMEEYVRKERYDLTIRCRPDIFLTSFSLDPSYKTHIVIPHQSKINKTKLADPSVPHIDDTFAYSTSDRMDAYFEIYSQLPSLMAKHGTVSETLLLKHLEESKIPYHLSYCVSFALVLSMCNAIAITGDSGSGKTTLSNLLKTVFSKSFVLECDRYHKWERNDENWKIMTHLNTDANYLLKMNDDVFNLKIGSDIYQVDYDHNTGKFTPKQHIPSPENLIVCGLHCLYTSSLSPIDQVYNLKIFMDTDDDLKTNWKIDRDVSKRGYTREKVMSQIEFRKKDYQTFVAPQKKSSDLIIKFFGETKESKTADHLKLSIAIHHNVSKIASFFSEQEIVYSVNYDVDFVHFQFSTYKPLTGKGCEIFCQQNNFYDYILFVILNLTSIVTSK